jgi:hypothetical protein
MSTDSQAEPARLISGRGVLLEGESADCFSELLHSLEAYFQPKSALESSLVESMAVARWRILRSWSMETSGMALEMEKQPREPERDAATRAAIAFRNLSDQSRLLDQLIRYEARCSREFHRSMRALIDLRARQIVSKPSRDDYDPYVD